MHQHQQAVRNVLETLASAMRAKDAAAVIGTYAEDVTGYDLAPPLVQSSMMMRDRASLEQWFATWDGPVRIEAGDTTVEVDGDLAVAWSLRHMTGVKVEDGDQSLWFRSTAVLRRQRDGWEIVHLHESVPFAMDGSGVALLELSPEAK